MFLVLVDFILILFSTVSLLYISMSTSVGPWISPVVIIFYASLLKIFKKNLTSQEIKKQLCLSQSPCMLAGLIATAIGFALPTLYFLSKNDFAIFTNSKISFCLTIGITIFLAGILGTFAGDFFANSILQDKKYKFPISKLITNSVHQIESKNNFHVGLGAGFTGVILSLKEALKSLKNINLSIYPTMCAVGFMSGAAIIIPMACGIFVKLFSSFFLIDFLVNQKIIAPTQELLFLTGIASGIILTDFFLGMLTTAKNFFKKEQIVDLNFDAKININVQNVGLLFLVSSACFAFFKYLGANYTSSLFLVLTIIFLCFEITKFSANLGMVPFGRFTTFTVIPAIFLTKCSPILITLICVFAGISFASAANLITQYQIAETQEIKKEQMFFKQIFAILICTIITGFLLLLIFKNFQLGSAQLFAQRGFSKALLLNSLNMDPILIAIGICIGLTLNFFRIKSMIVFGSLVMPLALSLSLIFGATVNKISKGYNKINQIATGIFAGESIFVTFWILFRTIF